MYGSGDFEFEKIVEMFQTVKGLYQALDEKRAKLNEIIGRYDEELKILQPAPPAGQAICPSCGNSYISGEMLFYQNKNQLNTDDNEEILRILIGKNTEYYTQQFMKIKRGEKSFNWCAFLFGPILVLYRKLFSYFAKVFLPTFVLPFIVYIVNLYLYEFARPVGSSI